MSLTHIFFFQNFQHRLKFCSFMSIHCQMSLGMFAHEISSLSLSLSSRPLSPCPTRQCSCPQQEKKVEEGPVSSREGYVKGGWQVGRVAGRKVAGMVEVAGWCRKKEGEGRLGKAHECLLPTRTCFTMHRFTINFQYKYFSHLPKLEEKKVRERRLLHTGRKRREREGLVAW